MNGEGMRNSALDETVDAIIIITELILAPADNKSIIAE